MPGRYDGARRGAALRKLRQESELEVILEYIESTHRSVRKKKNSLSKKEKQAVYTHDHWGSQDK